MSILIVEDEAYIRDQLSEMMERFSQNVVTAENGLKGMKEFQKNHYDLVFTDINMPERDGFWLIDRILERSPMHPIIIITAFSDNQTLLKCLERGVSGFVNKPVHMPSILKTVHRIGNVLYERKILEHYINETEKYFSSLNKQAGNAVQTVGSEAKEEGENKQSSHLSEQTDDVFSYPPTQFQERQIHAITDYLLRDIKILNDIQSDMVSYTNEILTVDDKRTAFHNVGECLVEYAEVLSKYPPLLELSDLMFRFSEIAMSAIDLKELSTTDDLKYYFIEFSEKMSYWHEQIKSSNFVSLQSAYENFYCSAQHLGSLIRNAVNVDENSFELF